MEITLQELFERTHGVLISMTFTYDIMNHYQCNISANDSNPETGYHMYMHNQRYSRYKSIQELLKAIELDFIRLKIIDPPQPPSNE